MKSLQRFAWSLVLAGVSVAPAFAESRAQKDLVRASLVTEARTVRVGRPFWVAVRLQMKNGWHVNWLNPGDAGLPPAIAWELPEGFSPGPIRWPCPEKIVLPELAIFGYGGEVLLLSEITPPRSMPSTKSVVLKARVEWLACAEVCVPGQSDLALTVEVGDQAPAMDPAWEPSFVKARESLPVASSTWGFDAVLTDDRIRILLSPPEKTDGDLGDVFYFPAVPGVIENASPQRLRRAGKVYHLDIERARIGPDEPSRIQGVLVSDHGWGAGTGKAVEIDVAVTK
jgi:thiol:disulfide interchange protein DsbD